MDNSEKTIGIDRMSFYTPNYVLDIRELAGARGVDPEKFTVGIGQDKQSVIPSSQDAVTMGASAALRLRGDIDDERLGLVILGTESGVDASKAGALYIHELLGLPRWVRVMEIKEACYGGTAGLLTARDYIAAHPGKQALVIASDIARYGIGSAGEVTQGGGAVAMLITENPRIMSLDLDSVVYSASIQDFWRPVYTDEAIARGKYSTDQYMAFFAQVWDMYTSQYAGSEEDFAAMCFHLPYAKMGQKTMDLLIDMTDSDADVAHKLRERFQASARYCKQVGNIYTGSLYLGLISLLDNDDTLEAGDTIGLFSYGSGAVAEFFTGKLVDNFRDALYAREHREMLDERKKVSVAEYEEIFADSVPYGPQDYVTKPQYYCGNFILAEVSDQERRYSMRYSPEEMNAMYMASMSGTRGMNAMGGGCGGGGQCSCSCGA